MEVRKTALVLGGGGARGAYEIGVWQALRELGIPIHIVTGTSVGAINGALIAQDAFELSVTLWKELETSMVFDMGIKDILANNGIDNGKLEELLKQYIDETAIRKSSVEYGLVTAELPSLAPKFFMKEQIPEGMLVDYILASSALFPAMKSHEINSLKYVDGGYTDNLPVGLALDHGATHVIAVDLDVFAVIRKQRIKDADFLRIIECSWDLGNILIFDKSNSRRIMRLGYLDTLKAYQVYDGSFYCFAKGEFDKRHLQGTELAGVIFGLDPELIYKKYIYNIHLKNAVDAHINAAGKELQTDSNTLKGIIQESILKAKATLNQKTLILIIARSLKESGDTKNIFLTRPVMKLLRDEILAANYLIKESLI